MSKAHEIFALSRRVEYLLAARYIAASERSDGKVWVVPSGSVSMIETADDIHALARQLDRHPVGGDLLATVAELDEAIGTLNQRLRELRRR